MTNLLQETNQAIASSGHTETDIVFIGSETSGHQCTWAEFCAIADVEYDSGYGAAKVATDLVFVFSDGQKMWRGEYDGSEWWEYSTPHKQPEPEAVRPIKSVLVSDDQVGWCSLAECNGDEEQ